MDHYLLTKLRTAAETGVSVGLTAAEVVQVWRAVQERETDLQVLAERFCATPLPETVCADLCATWYRPKPPYDTRSGTNLLTVVEAKQMLGAILPKEG